HRAEELRRCGDGHADQRRGGAHGGPACAPLPGGPVRHHGRDHHEGGGGAAVLSTRRPEAHAHLALHRQERARRGLGGRRQFHLGCERLRRDPDPVVLSARGEPRLGALDGVCAPLDQALLREMAPLPLPDRDQRGRSGGRDGVPDDRVLRAPCRGSRPVRRDNARAGPRVVSHDRGPPPLLGQAEYNKPATGLYLLREHILADTARFDAAFRAYIRRWAYKHPTPADFFRSMEDGLGEDLSWFWRGWFYRTDVVDL